MTVAVTPLFIILFQFSVHGIVHGLEPFVRAVLAGHLDREVAEPAVGRGAVPVLYAGRDIDSVAGIQLNGILALLLIIAAAGNAYEDLSAAAFGVVDMPVVASARLEGDVINADLTC